MIERTAEDVARFQADMARIARNSDRDYERIFVGDRQIDMTHFFAVNWTEDAERPTLFAFGYWSHDGIFHQGFAGWNGETFTLKGVQS